MAVNIDHVLELITRATNELGRVKDQLLMEKQHAEMPQTELLTREQWERIAVRPADQAIATPATADVKLAQQTASAPKGSSKS